MFRKEAASDAAESVKKTAEDVKVAAGKKLDEAQKAGEGLKKKVSDGAEDLWVPRSSFSSAHHLFFFSKDKASDAAKAAQKTADSAKAAGDQKLNEAKKTGESLKKKASDGVEDLWVGSERAIESLLGMFLGKIPWMMVRKQPRKQRTTLPTKHQVGHRAFSAAHRQNASDLEQGEKLKRQASDAGAKVKTAAQDAKKKVEVEADGALGQLFQALNGIKETVLGKLIYRRCFVGIIREFFPLETFGLASKHTADLADQAKEKFDEVAGKAKKNAEKTKKAAKGEGDL